MDNRRRTVLLIFVAGYFVIVAVLFFLIPYLGVKTVFEGLAVWILAILAIALVAGRRKKGQTPPRGAEPSPQKRHKLLPEAIRI